jgi:hypothetical protein
VYSSIPDSGTLSITTSGDFDHIVHPALSPDKASGQGYLVLRIRKSGGMPPSSASGKALVPQTGIAIPPR